MIVGDDLDIRLRCAYVADAIFPQLMDLGQRQRLALALVELTRSLKASASIAVGSEDAS